MHLSHFAAPFTTVAAIFEATKKATSGSKRKPGLVDYLNKQNRRQIQRKAKSICEKFCLLIWAMYQP